MSSKHPINTTRIFGALLGFLALVLALMASCGAPNNTNNNQNNTGPTDQRVEVPTAPAADVGLQFVMPETVIPAGTEKMICWIPNWVPDKNYSIKRFVGLQGKMGHHVVALRSNIPRQAGSVFDCTNIEQMTSIRPLVLTDISEDKPLLPEGYAVQVQKESKIVIQSHYVNTSDKDIKVADVAQFFFAKDPNTKLASYFIVNHGAVDLPPGKQSVSLSCTVKHNMNVLLLFGHMHEYGSALKIELEHEGQRKELYNVPQWLVDYRDKAPINFFGQENQQPELTFAPGDKVHLHCDFNNTTQKDIRFPSEMCTLVAYYHSNETNEIITCGEGN